MKIQVTLRHPFIMEFNFYGIMDFTAEHWTQTEEEGPDVVTVNPLQCWPLAIVLQQAFKVFYFFLFRSVTPSLGLRPYLCSSQTNYFRNLAAIPQ